jgi:glycosyltransferase involved in cell wall biosynthesis
MTISIAVIITTYKRPDALMAVLDGLLQQTDQNFDVIIADDGSGDEVRQVVADYKAQFAERLTHVWQEDSGFRATMIRNKAAAKTTADYLIFIDADCVPNQHFIARHRKLAESGFFVAGSRILLNENFTDHALKDRLALANWRLTDWWQAKRQKYCNRWLPALYFPWQLFRRLRPNTWNTARTCNFAVFRTDFIAVNGFNEAYHGWGFEDSDLAIRLLKSGVRHKSGRFAVMVVHLWHPQNDRAKLASNDARLKEILDNTQIRAEKGVGEYLA